MWNEKMYELGSKRSVIREIFEYSKARSAEIGKDKVFDFSIGNPSVPAPEEIKQGLISLLQSEDSLYLHGYTSAQGDIEARRAVSEKIKRDFGVDITQDNIYMTCGAAASLTISLKALMNDGEECIVFAPFFTEYRVFIENAGAKVVVSMPEEKTFGIDIADFESRITDKTRAVIVNSPNNPSGVVYSEEKICELAGVLSKKSKEFGHPIYLIADEPYRELVFEGVKVPFVMNYYKNSLVCYSYSKALSLPGERIGYVAVSPEADNSKEIYLAICGAGRSLGYVCAPSLFQHLIAKCINSKVDVNVYKENRDILYNGLTELGYECVKPEGAFYLFVKALEPDSYRFYERAREKELLLVPCDDFGVLGYVRIAYCVDRERIVNSLPAFKALIEEYNDNRKSKFENFDCKSLIC